MSEETSFLKLKRALLELKDGYPTHIFWGKIEYFQQPGVGKKAVDLLVRHEVIEKITSKELDELLAHISPEDLAKMPPSREERLESYRLTAKGVELTIAMINLEHSEKVLDYTEQSLKLNKETLSLSKETKQINVNIEWLTKVLMGFGILTLFLMCVQIVFQILQLARN